MKALQALRHYVAEHKYAINAKQLGDPAELPWSNLGYWDESSSSYPQACQQLAAQLAEAVKLKSTDRLLDLGCGQGASLVFWQQHYQLQQPAAVELQARCVMNIQRYLPALSSIHQHSFLKLAELAFQHPFDVVLCIDAAYHCNIQTFLTSVSTVLAASSRLGFHCLIWSEQAQRLSALQKQKYRWLLKAADINTDHLMTACALQQTLQRYDLLDIEITDLSRPVLLGFSRYFQQLVPQGKGLDAFKIRMTAQLCSQLYADGWVQYVQVSAKKRHLAAV